MSDYTPGPWEIRLQPTREIWSKQTHALICLPTGDAYRSISERNANLSLISAAPDLFEALWILRGVARSYELHGSWDAKVDAAINKALGKS